MPVLIPQALDQIAKQLKENSAFEHLPLTTRGLLQLFGAERRGFNVVVGIRQALKALGLETDPDFENIWIDSPIRIKLAPKEAKPPSTSEVKQEAPEPAVGQAEIDPTFRIGRLQSVSSKVVSIGPEDSIQKAITVMLQNHFSQLPVMTSERSVKGIITWMSIGTSLGMGGSSEKVRDCMANHFEVREDASLFEALPGIIANGYVLIRGGDNALRGIFTVGDLSQEFRQLTEPFLLLQEIEQYLRRLLERVPREEFKKSCQVILEANSESGPTADIADLALGDYLRLLENPQFWSLLNLKLDRSTFVQELHEIRRIRNRVMHFDQDGVTEEDRYRLTNCSTFFQAVNSLILPNLKQKPPNERKVGQMGV